MRIVVDGDKCQSIGMCEAMAQEFFEVQDDGPVLVLADQPGEEHRTDLAAAVSSCPVLALTLQD